MHTRKIKPKSINQDQKSTTPMYQRHWECCTLFDKYHSFIRYASAFMSSSNWIIEYKLIQKVLIQYGRKIIWWIHWCNKMSKFDHRVKMDYNSILNVTSLPLLFKITLISMIYNTAMLKWRANNRCRRKVAIGLLYTPIVKKKIIMS